MSGGPTTNQGESSHPADRWVEEDMRLLTELAHLGMSLARSLAFHVEVQDEVNKDMPFPPYVTPAATVTLDFTRISRSVRLTLALRKSLWGSAATGAEAGSPSTRPLVIEDYVPCEMAAADLAPPMASDIDCQIPKPEILKDSPERPDREWESERFIFRSPGQAIAQICRDYGLFQTPSAPVRPAKVSDPDGISRSSPQAVGAGVPERHGGDGLSADEQAPVAWSCHDPPVA